MTSLKVEVDYGFLAIVILKSYKLAELVNGTVRALVVI